MAKLPVLLSELSVLSVSQRLSCGLPIGVMTGDECVEEPLADEVLPKRRWVESVTSSSKLPLLSHQGQLAVRFSQPSSWSLEGCYSLVQC